MISEIKYRLNNYNIMIKYKLMYFNHNIILKENQFILNNNNLENIEYIIIICNVKLGCLIYYML